MSWDLVADIGGTNARFAAVENGALGRIETYPSARTGGLIGSAAEFVDLMGSKPARVVAGIAGPVSNGMGKLTNGDFAISERDLRALTSTGSAQVLNDFTIAAWAVARPENITCLQGPDVPPKGHRLVVGLGTGLGVGHLIDGPRGPVASSGEGGHIGISPMSHAERDVFAALAEIWPEAVINADGLRFEAEALLSGTGLPYFDQAVAQMHGVKTPRRDAKEIIDAATSGEAIATQVLSSLRTHFGQVAGDLSLVMPAHGGVFICGGIAIKNPALFDQVFLDAFNKGARFSDYRAHIPIYLMNDGDFGLLGASNALAAWI